MEAEHKKEVAALKEEIRERDEKIKELTAKNDATEIRKKRNMVHAKLCLKDCEHINAELCRKVIEYLKGIVKVRFEQKT